MVIKESGISNLSEAWAHTHFICTVWAEAVQVSTIQVNVATTPIDPQEFSEALCIIKTVPVNPFESLVVKGRCNTVFTAERLRVMTHGLGKNDGHQPQNLEVMNTYTVLKQGSKSVSVVLKNLMGQPVTVKKGAKIARCSAANTMPEWVIRPGTMEHLDEQLGIKKEPMTVE